MIGYLTEYHQGIIPSILSKEGKEIFAKDNKTYIFDKKNKKRCVLRVSEK
jgi:hypothetical protein